MLVRGERGVGGTRQSCVQRTKNSRNVICGKLVYGIRDKHRGFPNSCISDNNQFYRCLDRHAIELFFMFAKSNLFKNIFAELSTIERK